MKKSVKKRTICRSRKSYKRKSIKIKQKGRGRLNNRNSSIKTTFLPKVNGFIKETTSYLPKTPENLEYIKSKILDNGIVYDFIFELNKKTNKTINKYSFEMIWNHGTKQKLEEITAGKPGLHVYVQELDKKLNLLGIIQTSDKV